MALNIHEPTRSTMRLIFQLALSASELPGARKEIQNASNYHEYLWLEEDKKEEKEEGAKKL